MLTLNASKMQACIPDLQLAKATFMVQACRFSTSLYLSVHWSFDRSQIPISSEGYFQRKFCDSPEDTNPRI